ncbi:MAG: DUF2189 domain-containing protein [Alphaproteobacteria bacterium]|nr:DUF2189 domain-containing protein [Alphaproteobacteria bacterium]MBV8413567.1 DUF2189 domain-containing protein [Alphaproteobacteria bacterium]
MASTHIRNPVEWSWEQLKQTGQAVGSAANTMTGAWDTHGTAPPVVRRIGLADLRAALRDGARDFESCRTDVIFLCLIYPIAGFMVGRFAFNHGLLPLIFPLIAGFALIAPLFGVGLYEISRRRERGIAKGWTDVFTVVHAPAIGSILVMGLILLALFALWLFAASFIYTVTLGPDLPISASQFARDVLTTPQGWTMIGVGMGVGFLFALAVLTISVVSFPLLLDRNVGVYRAIATSVRAVRENPGPMAAWGLIIAAGLLVGTIPLLVGLAIALPILGHATWHLYRRAVA